MIRTGCVKPLGDGAEEEAYQQAAQERFFRAKPPSSGAKPRARKPASRAAGPRPLPPPTTTLQQELRMMAQSGAQSLQSLIVFLAVLVVIAGIGIGAWSMRPVPSYASVEQKAGSPFDATFTAENTNPWFPLKGLKLNCVLDHVRASGREPTLIEATDVRFPAGAVDELKPGEVATFRCPFRALFGLPPLAEDYSTAHRAQIYFRQPTNCRSSARSASATTACRTSSTRGCCRRAGRASPKANASPRTAAAVADRSAAAEPGSSRHRRSARPSPRRSRVR